MSKTRGRQYKHYILEGSFLAVDPSSGKTSAAGWALFQEGKLVESGIIEVCSVASKENRLREIMKVVSQKFDPVDLLIVEKIDGRMATRILIQACGVYIASIESTCFFEMNIQSWQAIAKRLGGWKKTNKIGDERGDPNGREGDEVDAIYIGHAAVAFAMGYDSKDSEEKKEEILSTIRGMI
jgi:hypothetical protein